MRPLRVMVIYLGVVFIGGALLAPWLYRLAQTVASSFPHIAGSPFHRFVDRSLLILALAGLWPLLRALNVASGREIGLISPHGQWKKILGGLLLGSMMLGVVAAGAVGVGGRAFIHGLAAHKIVGSVFSAIATAVMVAVLEEILFRGAIFGGLRKTFYWPLALAASSVIYAFVHFLSRPELTGPVAWYSGLALLPRMLGGFADFHALVPGLFNFTLAGILLCLAYQRTGNLYFSIGLHAGWIFWLKTYGAFTADAPRGAAWFWGTGRLMDGWLAFLMLAATLAAFKYLFFKPAREPYAMPR